jgi:hypothetical protein
MKRKPTFELLSGRRELPVINPAMGRRFVIWAVRVLPAAPCPADKVNPFVQKHRLLSRPVIEEWLDRLRLVQTRLSGSSVRSSP